MGTLHRNLKIEKAGDAALGMMVRIWSYCADTGRHILTDRDLAVIMVRDKNGPRKLKALLEAGFLDKVEGGYSPHDWFDHNPGLKPDGDSDPTEPGPGEGLRDADVSASRVDREPNATSHVTGNVTANVRKPVEENQGVTTPLSRPRTQDPREFLENSETPDARVRAVGLVSPPPANLQSEPKLGANPAAADREPGEPDRERLTKATNHSALVLEAFRAVCFAASVKMPRLWGAKLDQAVEHCRELHALYGKARGVSLHDVAAAVAVAAEPGAKGWDFDVSKVDPYAKQRAPQGRPGRMRMAPATTHADFEDAEPFEQQLARVRGES